MTAPAALSWAAYLGYLGITGTWLAFLGSIWTVIIFTILALIELVTDQLPSRKVPQQLITRLLTGALAGATIGAGFGLWIGGLVAGIAGAMIGTYGGAAVRAALAKAFGRDMPAAFVEDAVAILGAWLIIHALISLGTS